MASAHGIRAGRAYVELFTEDSRLVRGLNRAQKRLAAFGRASREIGMRLAATTAVLATPLAMSTKMFASFDDAMRKVKAVTSATEAQFERLSERAQELGKTTSYTATEVANAMVEMGRAGFNPDEINAAIDGMLSLAKATDTELPRATEIAGAALRGFNLEAREMGRVADVLAFGANNSAQTLDDLGESLKLVAPLAVETGESIEDVVTLLGILANSGIKGSMAGTAVARAMKNLSDEANQSSLATFGVTVADAAGNLRPLADIMEDLGKKMRGMGSAKRLALLEKVFGRGSTAAAKLARSAGDIDKFSAALREAAGYAKRTADEMDAGIGGSIRKFMSAFESVMLRIGKAVEEPFQAMIDHATRVVQAFSDWVAVNRAMVMSVVKILSAAAAAAAAFIALGMAGSALAFVVGGIASAFKLVGAVLATTLLPFTLALGIFKLAITAVKALAVAIPMILSPVGLVTAAVVGLAAVLLYTSGAGGRALDWLGEKFDVLRGNAVAAWQGIADALAGGNILLAVQILWLALKAEWQRGIAALEALWLGFKKTLLDVGTRAFYGLAEIAAEAGARIQAGWVSLVAALKTVWIEFVGWLDRSLLDVGIGVTKKIIGIMGKFNKSIDVDAISMALDIGKGIKAEEIEGNTKKALEGVNQGKQEKLAGIEQERQGVIDALSNAANAELAARTAENEAALNKAQEDLAKAKSELAEALEEAAEERDAEARAAETMQLLLDIEKADKEKAEKKKKLQAAGDAMDAATQRTDVIGSFSAAAIKLMGPNSLAADRTAAATEATAKNTKDFLRKVEDIVGQFA